MRAACVVRGAWVTLAILLITSMPPSRLAAQERAVPLAPDGYVRVFNSAGTIHVLGWEIDSVRWGGRLAPGQELFGGGSIRMVKLGPSGPDGPADLTVRVPRGAKLVVDAGDARVEIEGVTGPVEIRGGAGAVKVTGTPVRLTIETVDGSVELAGGPFRSVDVRTAGGGIQGAGLREEMALSTVTGAITARAGGVTRGRIVTVEGTVRLAADMDRTGTLTIESHGGDVDLALDPGSGSELLVTALGGRIENTLTRTAPRPVRRGRGIQLETIVGTGGGTVTVTSFRGNVRIGPR